MKSLFKNHRPCSLLSQAVTGLTLAILSCGALAQQDGDRQQALRELSIMRNIFAAALEEDESRNRMRFAEPESMYLAGQGMVFTFNLPGQLNSVIFSGFNATAPLNIMGAGDDFNRSNFEFAFDRAGRSERFAGMVSAGTDPQLQQQLRDITESMRDKQEGLSRLQRDLRSLRRAEDGSANEDDARELEASIDALTSELRSDEERYSKIMADYQAERNAERDELRLRQTDSIFSTLCNYGKTLTSLQQGEHVNLVLRNFSDRDTQVFVMDIADVSACTSPQALREAAISYSM